MIGSPVYLDVSPFKHTIRLCTAPTLKANHVDTIHQYNQMNYPEKTSKTGKYTNTIQIYKKLVIFLPL